MPSPVGELRLVVDDHARLTQIIFEGDPTSPAAIADPNCAEEAVRELEQYFAGTRHEFTVPLAPEGTPFQREVWDELLRIPYGQTRSYAQVAQAIGRPSAMRAVGAANGSNPIPIIIPCHRVIGANGSLTGYGGGLPIKEKLLQLEGLLTPSLA